MSDSHSLYKLSLAAVGTFAFLFARYFNAKNVQSKIGNDKTPEIGDIRVKIASRVAAASDLLIKKIARETAQLVSSLPSDRKIVNMSQGVPCLPIFDQAYDEMVKLLNTKLLPYSDVPGSTDVRKVCAQFVNKMYSIGQFSPSFDEENITVTSGAIQAIYCCLAISIDSPNDVVLTTLPAYGLYKQQTNILGGKFCSITTNEDNKFVPTGADLKHNFELHTRYQEHNGRLVKMCDVRSIVLCFPNNPTGAMLNSEQAKDITQSLHDLLVAYPTPGFSVILDEVYLGITSSSYVSLLQYASPLLRNSMFIILSASKGLGTTSL
jgi:aspartate/methionine/tyrosine aminotransferase